MVRFTDSCAPARFCSSSRYFFSASSNDCNALMLACSTARSFFSASSNDWNASLVACSTPSWCVSRRPRRFFTSQYGYSLSSRSRLHGTAATNALCGRARRGLECFAPPAADFCARADHAAARARKLQKTRMRIAAAGTAAHGGRTHGGRQGCSETSCVGIRVLCEKFAESKSAATEAALDA